MNRLCQRRRESNAASIRDESQSEQKQQGGIFLSLLASELAGIYSQDVGYSFSAEQRVQTRPPTSWISFLTVQPADKRPVISLSAFLRVWPCIAFVLYFFPYFPFSLKLPHFTQNTAFSMLHTIKQTRKRNTFWLRLIFFFSFLLFCKTAKPKSQLLAQS